MQSINNSSILNILMNTLNLVDHRLVDHGRRVSYYVYKMLKYQNKYSKEEIRDILFLSIIHDIGAYKTEEISRLVNFETKEIWDHSIYGYLFIKYFSPLKNLAPIVLYHHTDYQYLVGIDAFYEEVAQIMHIADRADIYFDDGKMNRDKKIFVNWLKRSENISFRSDLIDLFDKIDLEYPILNNIENDEQYYNIMYKVPFSEEDINDYIKMIVLSIDFRSYHTVTHTVTMSSISVELAKLMNLPPEDIQMITIGSMLHDIGKIGIPVNILENPGKLSDEDMEIMKTHVELSEDILINNIDTTIMNIGIRHHEKLNGSGYPKKLKAEDLTLMERIVAVADIVSALYGVRSYKDSFPKEKILKVIQNMSDLDLIDSNIVTLITEHYDYIIEKASEQYNPVITAYNNLNEDLIRLKNATKNIGNRTPEDLLYSIGLKRDCKQTA